MDKNLKSSSDPAFRTSPLTFIPNGCGSRFKHVTILISVHVLQAAAVWVFAWKDLKVRRILYETGIMSKSSVICHLHQFGQSAPVQG